MSSPFIKRRTCSEWFGCESFDDALEAGFRTAMRVLGSTSTQSNNEGAQQFMDHLSRLIDSHKPTKSGVTFDQGIARIDETQIKPLIKRCIERGLIRFRHVKVSHHQGLWMDRDGTYFIDDMPTKYLVRRALDEKMAKMG